MAAVYQLVTLDLDTQIPTPQSPELGELAAALEVLVQQLRREMVHASHMEAMFTELPTLLLQLDAGGLVVAENQVARAFFGVPVGGESVVALLRDLCVQERALSLPELLSGVSLELLDAQHQERSFQLKAAPLLDQHGGIQGFLLHGVDRSADERALRAERAAVQAGREAAEMRSRVMAALSHELRTPLNGVLGFTQLLELQALDARGREELSGLRTAGEQLQRLVGDVLDYAALDVGDFELRRRDLELRQLLEVVGDLGLVASLDGLPDWVRGDMARLRQLLLRLGEFMVALANGGPLKLRVDAWETAKGYALSWSFRAPELVLGPAEQAHLFAPLEATGSVRGRAQGQGLGLGLCRALCAAMDGSLHLESAPVRGTEICAVVSVGRSQLERSASDALRDLRVAVVDDNPVNLMVAMRILQSAGARAEGFPSGVKAVEALADPGSVELVLMDLEMPEMDGLEATRRLRAGWGGRGPSVLALTALEGPQMQAECAAAGLDGVLHKPFDVERLRALLGARPCRHSGS